MSKKRINRMKELIEDGRQAKLKSYIKKHGILPSDVLLGKNRNLLHHCCKHGISENMLKYLLKAGVDPYHTDDEGNLPLHLALKRALGESNISDVYTDFVLPHLKLYPDLLEETNNAGVSCRKLLDMLVEKKRQRNSGPQDFDNEETEGDRHEREWREKLSYEMEDDGYCGDQQGFLDHDRETYDQWAERISREFHRKKQTTNYPSSHTHTKKKTKHKPEESDSCNPPNLENIREQMRKKYEENQKQNRELYLIRKRSEYEKRFETLLACKSSDKLKFEDIPWPCKGNTSDITEALFGHFPSRQSDSFKKYLREQQKRWHPDKFSQKFGARISDEDREKILERVKEISQALNKLSEK